MGEEARSAGQLSQVGSFCLLASGELGGLALRSSALFFAGWLKGLKCYLKYPGRIPSSAEGKKMRNT